MQGSKIRLSDAEKELFQNAEVILTKNSILQKTIELLAEVQQALEASPIQPSFSSSPKISRGENYMGLPYVVLDYPRIAKEGDLFFIRSMFWWGHFYSSTLQLAGRFKTQHIQSIVNGYDSLAGKNYFIGIHPDPWQHHFEASNYQPVSALGKSRFAGRLQQQPQIKIAAQWPLSEWDSAANNLTESWRALMHLVT